MHSAGGKREILSQPRFGPGVGKEAYLKCYGQSRFSFLTTLLPKVRAQAPIYLTFGMALLCISPATLPAGERVPSEAQFQLPPFSPATSPLSHDRLMAFSGAS